jgi:hypothetical protein
VPYFYFEIRFSTVDFQISEMPIDLLGAGTDRRPGRFQLPTPNKSIGPSEVAGDCFKAGWIRLPLVGGRFLEMFLGELQVYDMNFEAAKYEHSLPAKSFFRTAVFGGGSISGAGVQIAPTSAPPARV